MIVFSITFQVITVLTSPSGITYLDRDYKPYGFAPCLDESGITIGTLLDTMLQEVSPWNSPLY